MESEIAAAKADEQTREAQLSNLTGVELAKRNFELKKAAYDTEVNAANAEANLAFQLQVSTLSDSTVRPSRTIFGNSKISLDWTST